MQSRGRPIRLIVSPEIDPTAREEALLQLLLDVTKCLSTWWLLAVVHVIVHGRDSAAVRGCVRTFTVEVAVRGDSFSVVAGVQLAPTVVSTASAPAAASPAATF